MRAAASGVAEQGTAQRIAQQIIVGDIHFTAGMVVCGRYVFTALLLYFDDSRAQRF